MQHLRDRYWRKERVGDLWNEFCELQQRNGETIEQFIERIETVFRQIKPSLERGAEGDIILRERLLKGMLPTLRNSIQHLREETMTYGALITSAQKAEEERKRIETDLNSTLKRNEGQGREEKGNRKINNNPKARNRETKREK